MRFFGGEDGGEVARSAGAQGIDAIVEGNLENVAVEEEEGAEGLVLGGCGNVFDSGKVGDEGFDLRNTYILGMPFVVEENLAANPLDAGFFGFVGVVFKANSVTDLIEQLFLGWGFHSCLVARTPHTP